MPDKSLSSRILSRFGYEKKSDRPNYGRDISASYFFSSLGYALSRESNFDYRRALGDLNSSSLVMAVCNDTGIALAEAEPAVRVPSAKGQMERDFSHPIISLIQNPNPYHIWEDYCLAGAFSWWADGNWYIQKVKNEQTGDVEELWYLPHCFVEPRWPDDGKTPAVPVEKNTDKFLSHYQFSIPGRQPVLIPAADMIHIKRSVNPDNPRKGIGAFDSLLTEIFGDQKRAQFSATILKNLGIIVPLLAPKDPTVTVDEPTAERIKQKWMQQTTGDNSGVPLINPIALEATKFAFSPEELDLKELSMVPESRVAAVTRYPAAYLQFLVGLQNGTSYASYKEAREQAYESVIAPIQKGVGRRITQQLLSEFEEPKGAQFYFDTSEVRVLQEDQDALVKRAATGYLAGVLSKADARRMLKLETTPEDETDYHSAAPVLGEPAKGFASVDEIDQLLYGKGGLEDQMKEFTIKQSADARP